MFDSRYQCEYVHHETCITADCLDLSLFLRMIGFVCVCVCSSRTEILWIVWKTLHDSRSQCKIHVKNLHDIHFQHRRAEISRGMEEEKIARLISRGPRVDHLVFHHIRHDMLSFSSDFHHCCHGMLVFSEFSPPPQKVRRSFRAKTSRRKLGHVGPDVGPCLVHVWSMLALVSDR